MNIHNDPKIRIVHHGSGLPSIVMNSVSASFTFDLSALPIKFRFDDTVAVQQLHDGIFKTDIGKLTRNLTVKSGFLDLRPNPLDRRLFQNAVHEANIGKGKGRFRHIVSEADAFGTGTDDNFLILHMGGYKLTTFQTEKKLQLRIYRGRDNDKIADIILHISGNRITYGLLNIDSRKISGLQDEMVSDIIIWILLNPKYGLEALIKMTCP